MHPPPVNEPSTPTLPSQAVCREVPPGRAEVLLDTRMPASGAGYGKATTFSAGRPVARWEAGSAAGLIKDLDAAIGRLRDIGPRGLLVGALPYAGKATGLLFPTIDAPIRAAPSGTNGFRLTERFRPDWDAPGYQAGVRKVLEYLLAGDAYQVNVAQRFTGGYEGNPKLLFDHLRQRFAPPYSAWLDLGDEQILCLSPESFLEVDGDRVITRPIKGTRPRGATAREDARIREELVAARKDQAENLMIVDLLRNDLGKVCVPGSVRVPAMFAVESFRNVHHLVSTVEGRLRQGAGVPELLAACFPGGSITGAPKRRAMEIIAELEPHSREIYCGTIFWMTGDGRFGSNIAIRTLLARDGLLHCWGGAGIVADSAPEAEWQECLDKVGPLMREAEMAFLSK